MTFLFAMLLVLVLTILTGLILAIVARTVRDHAMMRRTLDIVMLQVMLPKDLSRDEREEGVGEDIKERIAVAEQWLSTLMALPTTWVDRLLYGRPIVVLEIVARDDDVIVFFAGVERRYLDHLEKQIYAFYPEAEVLPAREHTIFEPSDTFYGASLKLAKAGHLPLATYRELEADTMQSLTGALAKIQNRDAAVIQYICQPAGRRARRKGKEAARRVVTGKQRDIGSSGSLLREATDAVMQSADERLRRTTDAQKLTPRAEERMQLVEQKGAQQQFDVNIRIGVSTRASEEAERVLNAILGAFTQYDMPDLNSLKVVRPRNVQRFIRDLIFRTARSGQATTLSTTELASLFHFPLPTTATPNILWRGAKSAPTPSPMPSEGIILGDNVYRGIARPVHFALDDRRRHMYLIGQTGTGKTTLFLNMIRQDIAAGHGVGVVDPHGDLIEDILLHIPPERQADVILFDPKDTERPLGFNILETKNPAQKDLVVNEVVQILQKLAARLNPESVGPMFEHYLRNALGALSADPEATLLDVPRMFVDEEFRTRILQLPIDPTVRQFWEKEFAQSQRGQMSADMLSYVISKLGRFIGNATVRNMIGQAKSSFDVREIMDQKKILLCNLSKGQLGDINADLLGYVLVSKIQIAALGRADVPEGERPDFYLYLDEFQNFTTDSIAVILSEARKYRLNLNLTHQFIQQLDESIQKAVFGNVGTLVSYRIGVDDAEYLAQQFAPVFSEYDLVNLDRFTAYVRLLIAGTPARPFSLKIPAPPQGGDTQAREAIRQHSRQTYGRSRVDVEQEIAARFAYGAPAKPDKPKPAGGDYLSESLFDIS